MILLDRSKYLCDLRAHAKFHNPGKKVTRKILGPNCCLLFVLECVESQKGLLYLTSKKGLKAASGIKPFIIIQDTYINY